MRRFMFLVNMAFFLFVLTVNRGTACNFIDKSSHDNMIKNDEQGALSILPLSRLPTYFIENQGQMDPRVKYYMKAENQTVYLTEKGLVFDLLKAQDDGGKRQAEKPGTQQKYERLVFSLELENCNKNASVEGEELLGAKVNYFIGNDRDQWKTDVPTYEDVIYKNIYEGIDLRIYAKGKALESEFIVKPKADSKKIRLAYHGINGLRKNKQGNLIISTPFGELKEHRPYIYQVINGKKIELQGEFRLYEDDSQQETQHTYGFEIASYDPGHPLVIDPTLEFSTYLGGVGKDIGRGIALDSSGNIYVAGINTWGGFPTQNAYQPNSAGNWDIVVTKLNSSGVTVYSTYLGGSDEEGYWADTPIAVDGAGNAYITGYTKSNDFPTQNPSQPNNAGSWDIFVTKLNAAGNGLVYSTYFGGTAGEGAWGIAVDGADNACICGRTGSTDFPIKNAEINTKQGGDDAYVTKFDATGVTVYSTYLGGAGYDLCMDIAVDTAGNAYATGHTYSDDFPTKNPFQANRVASADNFVTKLDSSGSSVFSTYLGGNGLDWVHRIRVDAAGNSYVAGHTPSTDFPTVNPYQATNAGGDDAFLTKIDSTGTTIVYSTYLGGTGNDQGHGLDFDSSGNAYVAGYTNSNDFPTLNPLQTNNAGMIDAFVTRFNSAGNAITFSTYLGGSNDDHCLRMVVDASDNAYIVGQTKSNDFPTVNALDSTYAAQEDVFIAKLHIALGPNNPPAPPTAISPADEAVIGVVSGVSLVSSEFSDPESDTHVRTHWLVRIGHMPYNAPGYDASFSHVATLSGLTEHWVNGLATGLKYVWKVGYEDSGSGITSWSREYAFKVGTSQADSNVSISAGTKVENFRMVSFVQWPDDPGSMSVFGDEMGGSYNRDNFRIGKYETETGQYIECGNEEVEPGEAWWVLARNGMDITVNGVPVSKSHNVEVDLDYGNGKGWNQIGCPNNADYLWGNVEVLEYNADGQIVFGPTAVSDLADPNPYIDKSLWNWENGSYNSNTTWMRKYEGYWVKAKKANVYLKFKVSAQAKLSNPGTMLAGLFSEWKNRIKGWVLSPNDAIADDGDSPPGPPGDFSVSARDGDSPGGGYGGSSSDSGTGGTGGGTGGGVGCFISTLTGR
ncbi:MAG: SBBP repeat-containing protein [Deltaproteobacteria bacterium]|nr:SBBP repeat-containing protein [Deltaproteobacteria bacterium]